MNVIEGLIRGGLYGRGKRWEWGLWLKKMVQNKKRVLAK